MKFTNLLLLLSFSFAQTQDQGEDPFDKAETYEQIAKYDQAYATINGFDQVVRVTQDLLKERIKHYRTDNELYQTLKDLPYRASLKNQYAESQIPQIRSRANRAAHRYLIKKDSENRSNRARLMSEFNAASAKVEEALGKYKADITRIYETEKQIIAKYKNSGSTS